MRPAEHVAAPISSTVLITSRLVLRAFASADIDRVAELVGDFEVVRNLARVPWPYGREQAREFVVEIAPTETVWAIVQRQDNLLVGAIGLTPGDTAELGCWIGRPHWGQGFATEAGAATLRHAFVAHAAEVLISGYFTDNPASGRVLAKLGFVPTGFSERPCLARGAPQASCEMRLDRDALPSWV